ncbi:MAG: type II toxin-antitoxin system HipA family toxin [Leptospirales bacterium]
MYKPVDRLNVCLRFGRDEFLVGALASRNGKTYFQYAPEFLARNIDLSPVWLKYAAHVQSSFPDFFLGLPGMIHDSLPDGWGLLLMDRHFLRAGIPLASVGPLDRLSYLGERGMGALVYRPDQKVVSAGHGEIDLVTLAMEAIRVFEGEPGEVLPELLLLGGSPGGARPKVLVAYDERTDRMVSGVDEIPTGYRQYLIKFPAESVPPYPGETEYAYSLMARAAGLHLPDTRLFPGIGDQKSFGIERFDRAGNDRFHVHTLGGLIHASHRLPSCTYETALKVTQAVTKNREEVLALFRQMVFNVATHNRDDHVRNFAFLLGPDGKWRLSPAYDLTYSAGPGGEHSMTLSGEGRNPSFEHIRRVADEFQIREIDVLEITGMVTEAVGNWNAFAKEAGVPKPVSDRIQGTFVPINGSSKSVSSSTRKRHSPR